MQNLERDKIISSQRQKALQKSLLPGAFTNTKPITISKKQTKPDNTQVETSGYNIVHKQWTKTTGGQMAQSKRETMKISTNNVNSSLTDQQSTLNDKGGNIFEKRETKIEAGPDYYFPKEKNSKGGYIGVKTEKNIKQQVPGPGKYNISRESIFDTKGSKFSQLEEKQPFVNSAGPGDYNIKRDMTGSGCYIGQKTGNMKKDITPGPGSYDSRNSSSTSFSIGKKSVEKQEIGPAPGQHQQVNEWNSTLGGQMSKTERDNQKQQEINNDPLQSQTSSLTQQGGSIHPRIQQKTEVTPGSTYIPRNESKGVYIGEKQRQTRTEIAPGPGQYNISRDRLFQNVTAKFSQLQDKKQKVTVGPGEYDVQRFQKQGGMIIHDRYKKAQKDVVPGPGSYF